MVRLSEKMIDLAQLHRLVFKALCAHGTEAENAEAVARALVAAEADGLPGHGLSRSPAYYAQVPEVPLTILSQNFFSCSRQLVPWNRLS